MAAATETMTDIETLADLLESLGGIAPSRVRFRPAPGTATEVDLIELRSRDDRLYELIDGVLVEKGMGFTEAYLAGYLIVVLRAFVDARNLGIVLPPDGTMRLSPGLVRIPDISYLSWDRFPDGRIPTAPLPDVAPDLAVEVLSVSNTRSEMQRKRREYFETGVRLVWEIDPRSRTVAVDLGLDDPTILHEGDMLDGGAVLPGFVVAVRDIFAELDRGRG